MGVAEGVAAALEAGVRKVAVSDERARKLREDADLLHGVAPAARVVGEVGQFISPRGVNVAARAGNPQPGLVCADDLGVSDGGLDPLLAPDQLSREEAARALDDGRRGCTAEEVAQRLGGARDWQELVEVQVSSAREQARAVLDGGVDSGREVAPGLGAAFGAAAGLSAVLGDDDAHGWEVEDLPALRANHVLLAERSAAAGARFRRVCDHVVGAG